jgi:hypothetical protein
MKNALLLIAVLLALNTSAHAQGTDKATGFPLPNGYFATCLSSDNIEQDVIRCDVLNNTEITAPSGKDIELLIAGTKIAEVNSTGIDFEASMGIDLPVYVPTAAATPVAATNKVVAGSFNAIPTAAANTAVCLPAVPEVGDSFEGINAGPNTVRLKACGTPGINGAAAGTYIPLATMTYFTCFANSATAYQCGTLAVPTPAGP